MKRILFGLMLLLGVGAFADNDSNPPARLIPVIPPSSPWTHEGKQPGIRTVGAIDFHGAPIIAVIAYLSDNLLHKPLIVPCDLQGTVTYKTNDLTVTEALLELSSVLQTNGLILTNVDTRYYRLWHIGETIPLSERPHLEVSIVTNLITVGTRNVLASEVLVAIEEQLTPQTEIWIQGDYNDRLNSYGLAVMLQKAMPIPHRIYEIYGRLGQAPLPPRPPQTASATNESSTINLAIPTCVAAASWVSIGEGFGFAITNLVLQEVGANGLSIRHLENGPATSLEPTHFITNAIEGHFMLRRGDAWYEVRSPAPSVSRTAYPSAPYVTVNSTGAVRRIPFKAP